MTEKLQSQAGWKWYGFAGHHICGARCQYHLTTSINGAYLVSTVGRFVPDPLREPNKTSTVGSGRDFETFVFAMSGDDENGDPIITSREPVDTDGYLTSIEAERGHYAMCQVWATVGNRPTKCDGNHGGPRCADPECWNDSPDAPPETIETAIQARKAAQEQLYAARERHAEEVKRLQAEIGRLQALRPVTMTDEQAKQLLKQSDLLDMFLHIGWYSAPRKGFDQHALSLIRAVEAFHRIGVTQKEQGK